MEMRTLNVPGFTAESAIYGAKAQYRVIDNFDSKSNPETSRRVIVRASFTGDYGMILMYGPYAPPPRHLYSQFYDKRILKKIGSILKTVAKVAAPIVGSIR
jgi:hypothetical protein